MPQAPSPAGAPGTPPLAAAESCSSAASKTSGQRFHSPAEGGDSTKPSVAAKSPRLGPQREATPAVQSLTSQADLLASRGRFAEALALVEEALRLEPQRADLHQGLGQCLSQLGRLDEAIQAFDAALQRDPEQRHILRSKAGALARQQRWEDAAVCLREVLKVEPGNSELRVELAQCLTEHGIHLKMAGKPGCILFQDALQVCDEHAPAYFQLGVEYSESGQQARAKEMYEKAVKLRPLYIEAWNNLGVACRSLGEPEHALEAYSVALKASPNCSKTRENMAICLLEIGCKSLQQKRLKKASQELKKALAYNSANADIYFNLGVLYAEQSKFDKARVNYELAVHFEPRHVNALNNMGVIHRRQGNLEAAVHCFERAVLVDPKMNLANKNLGAAFGQMGRMSESIKLTLMALEAQPNDAEVYNNLALLYRDQGDIDTCLGHLDACLKLEPQNNHANSNRLMTLNYPSEMSRDDVFEAHRAWGEALERKTPVEYTSWRRSESTDDGPLRVGYISPDFYTHSVSYFIHCVLKHHDRSRVHVTCYSDVVVEDDRTQLFKSYVPCWRKICGLPDEEVARQIHADGIDILVDLTGHTGNNRLAVLARKPAPVIVTWIGYPHTTGLSRVDYRITDEHADPVDAPGLTTEKLLRMPECFLCYTPPEAAPPVSLRPAQETYGCPTFGCFNTLAKVSASTVRLWCRVLREVPEARLFLKSKALQCPEVQDKFRRLFALQGVDAHRLDLSGLQPRTGCHLQMYSLVDVALDTLPYAGTTTTCEALFMGVPVVSLRGSGVHAQNVGASLLSAVQLPELAAPTEDEYVRQASLLVRDVRRLAALRAGLRTRMLRSPLCDGPRHVAHLERLYAGMIAGTDSCSVASAEVQ
mmetsp:Transcript_15902/g.29084  ORF Transcript_15902/g.29084 Transcript_15902/m.29084 type:complete len:876 (-) Transcript_15902:97-2724(-)